MTVRPRSTVRLYHINQDTSGDGICCMFMFGQGWYTVTEDGVEKAAGGFFVESETTIWGSCAPAPPCPSGQARYQVTVKTDYHPGDTTYTLKNTCSNAIILSESNFSSPYYTFRSEAVCADAGEMSFVINVSYFLFILQECESQQSQSNQFLTL